MASLTLVIFLQAPFSALIGFVDTFLSLDIDSIAVGWIQWTINEYASINIYSFETLCITGIGCQEEVGLQCVVKV